MIDCNLLLLHRLRIFNSIFSAATFLIIDLYNNENATRFIVQPQNNKSPLLLSFAKDNDVEFH